MQANRNIVIATGEFAGQIALSGYGAGGDPTAVAVVSDLYADRAQVRSASRRLGRGRGRLPQVSAESSLNT